jgi:hypothetical protein
MRQDTIQGTLEAQGPRRPNLRVVRPSVDPTEKIEQPDWVARKRAGRVYAAWCLVGCVLGAGVVVGVEWVAWHWYW